MLGWNACTTAPSWHKDISSTHPQVSNKTVRSSSHARQAVLIELARVRLHGFTEREMRAARGVQMAETESLFTERDQEYSDSRRCAALLRPIALAPLRPYALCSLILLHVFVVDNMLICTYHMCFSCHDTIVLRPRRQRPCCSAHSDHSPFCCVCLCNKPLSSKSLQLG